MTSWDLGNAVFASTINRLIMSRSGTPQGPLFIGVANQDGTRDGHRLLAADGAFLRQG